MGSARLVNVSSLVWVSNSKQSVPKGCVHRKYVSAAERGSSKMCIQQLLQKVPNSEPVNSANKYNERTEEKSTWAHKSFSVFTTQNTKLKWMESAWVWELVSRLRGISRSQQPTKMTFPGKGLGINCSSPDALWLTDTTVDWIDYIFASITVFFTHFL